MTRKEELEQQLATEGFTRIPGSNMLYEKGDRVAYVRAADVGTPDEVAEIVYEDKIDTSASTVAKSDDSTKGKDAMTTSKKKVTKKKTAAKKKVAKKTTAKKGTSKRTAKKGASKKTTAKKGTSKKTTAKKTATAPTGKGYKGHRAGTAKEQAHKIADEKGMTREKYLEKCAKLGVADTTLRAWWYSFQK